jgi:hypothetical protein
VESVGPEEYGDANTLLMCLTSCDGSDSLGGAFGDCALSRFEGRLN